MTQSLRNINMTASIVIALALIAIIAVTQFVRANTTSNLTPTADGAYTQWTPKTGTSHFAMVDETPCNGTTDHNSTATVGNRDSYSVSLTSVPAGAAILGVDVKPCASRNSSGGGSSTMNVFYRLNGTDSSDAGNYALSGTTPTELATTSFTGLSTVKDGSTTLEVGAVLSAGTKGARLSRIVGLATYLPAASNLTSTPSSTTTSIKLTWTDNANNENGYTVERSTDNVNFAGVSTTSANTNNFTDSGLGLGTKYYHRVRTFIGTTSPIYSGYSNTASSTTGSIPLAPSGLTVTATSTATSTDAIVQWTDNSTNETGFRVERGTDGINFSEIGTTLANDIDYRDVGLSSGTYYYRVRSYNGFGNSDYSNTGNVTIP
jgi:hypothetical protein